jgi:acyl transferase domain-containing protein
MSVDHMALLRSALHKLDELEQARSRPVEVLGLGLRLPGGVESPEAFWEFLLSDADGVIPVVQETDGRRSEHVSGRPLGALRDVARFDGKFFGLSDAEASRLDPQQRVVLEVTWQALADAGVRPEQLKGSRTAVFAGAYSNDWLLMQTRRPEDFNAYTAPGCAHSMLANRLSYLLDLQGPSFAVDSACSSSLSALHLACRSLRSGETDLAIVIGVNLVLDDVSTTVTGLALPMSGEGHCRAFDARADGIVRGEGCVVLVLRPHTPSSSVSGRALILGTAVGHGGRSAGLTAPSPAAQARVMRDALGDARVDPCDIAFIEAHGTGTALGDPIEMSAIAEVYGNGPQPCAVGSVKSSIGHLEASAGLAGLAKALLVLEHGLVPRQKHIDQLNPEIDLEGTRLRVATESWVLPEAPRRLAAVSSFGFGGANAHVVLEGLPGRVCSPELKDSAGPLLLALSASDDDAMGRLRSVYAERVAASPESAAELCAVTAVGNSQLLPTRQYFLSHDADALVEDLRANHQRPVTRSRPALVLVFSGQGSQFPRMGEDLLREQDLLTQFEQMEDEVLAVAGFSLLAALRDPGPEALRDTAVAQICIAAVQVALVQRLERAGLSPDAVLGHSVGEVTAAHVAGCIDRRTMFQLLASRAALMQAAAGGRMLQLRTDLRTAARATEGLNVDMAAHNDAQSVVFAGSAHEIELLEQLASSHGVATRRLDVDYAFHSRLLDGADAALADIADGLASRAPTLPFYSTVTGRELGLAPDGSHWGQNLRQPVLFAEAVQAVLDDFGDTALLEVAPSGVLQASLRDLAGPSAATVHRIMSRSHSFGMSFRQLLGEMHEAGFPLQWEVAFPDAECLDHRLRPAYPWSADRFWPGLCDPIGPGGAPPSGQPAPSAGRIGVEELARFIAKLAADLLDVATPLPLHVPLREWDPPSLTVVEMRNAVERRFGLTVPLALLLEGDSPHDCAAALLPARTPMADEPDLEALLANVQQMTDEEAELMLAELERTRTHDY